MNMIIRAALLSGLALGVLAACDGKGGKQEAAEPAEPVVLTPPAADDEQAWRQYLVAVVKQNMKGIRSSPYMYYLPPESDPEFADKYKRQLENVGGTIARGVLPGNMLAFGSPASAKMADLIVEGFGYADPGALNDVRVLFIGKPADSERVRAAVEPSGAEYVFVDIK